MTHSKHQKKLHNFGPGPAVLPPSVLQQAQSGLVDFASTGLSILEISHRSKEFEDCLNQANDLVRKLLSVPNNYEIIWMQGGATTQFSATVYNLLSRHDYVADYLVSGTWSEKAASEAKKLGAKVNIAFNTKSTNYTTIPDPSTWKLSPASKALYVYYCANETVNGVEFQDVPPVDPNTILVCDMSSNIMSRSVDVSKFGIIFGGVQKNLGPAGVSMVIIRKDLITDTDVEEKQFIVPIMLDFKVLSDNNSLYNTPPVFAIYVTKLVLEWLDQLGGIEAMERLNIEKSNRIYGVLDKSRLFRCPIDKHCRSRMNIPFRIFKDGNAWDEGEKMFLQEADEKGLLQLKGHRSVGGIRASLYNAMTMEGTEALARFMEEWEKKITN
ncbi:phosphoserine aminotransferase [Paraphysoderma sedebokerense]|nr:phosphoserine aminotransferase [Paraphysoderma sedebokerense]